MNPIRSLTIKEKTLKINLDNKIYGSFAEIGAGQEVAANFFKAGGASGTIARTISAYDMSFSDAIYGKSERYVSESRLMMMLEKEFSLLEQRLAEQADTTRFFAFADTVEALNYQRSNKAEGWVGLRFQLRPDIEPNECVIHVTMHDNEALLQQNALGLMGVNLIFACYFFTDAEQILQSLMDGLTPGRIEVDMFRVSGPDFKEVDNRLLSLKLVKHNMTKVAMFGPDGKVLQASEILYKKNVLVLRGRFKPVTHVNVDMLLAGRRCFINDPDVDEGRLVVLTELTLKDLKMGGEDIDDSDFLDRVDILCALGQNVMISNYYEYYRLVDYLSDFTRKQKIGIILGVSNLKRVFDERYYENLRGGILQSFGTLFGHNVKLYVYPSKADLELNTLQNFEVDERVQGLFSYLMTDDKLEDITTADTDLLHILSDNVLAMIQTGKTGWEALVPKKVAAIIKDRRLFNYKPSRRIAKVAEKKAS